MTMKMKSGFREPLDCINKSVPLVFHDKTKPLFMGYKCLEFGYYVQNEEVRPCQDCPAKESWAEYMYRHGNLTRKSEKTTV